MYFYDTLAGSKGLEPTSIAARANPQVRLHALAHISSTYLKVYSEDVNGALVPLFRIFERVVISPAAWAS